MSRPKTLEECQNQVQSLMGWRPSFHPSPHSRLTLQQNKEEPKDKIKKISLKQAPSLIQGHTFLISALATLATDVLWILLGALLHHSLWSPRHHFHSQLREGKRNSLYNVPAS